MTTLSVGLFFSFLMYIWGEKISIFDVKIFDVLIPFLQSDDINELNMSLARMMSCLTDLL